MTEEDIKDWLSPERMEARRAIFERAQKQAGQEMLLALEKALRCTLHLPENPLEAIQCGLP